MAHFSLQDMIYQELVARLFPAARCGCPVWVVSIVSADGRLFRECNVCGATWAVFE